MSIKTRYILFITGIFSMALGISLLIKSNLGTSPISSIPYILTEQSLYSIGTTTMLVNLLFLLAQIGLLRRKFETYQLMQIPITFIFAIFIDLIMALLGDIFFDIYLFKLLLSLLGSCFIGFGVALQIIAQVITLSGEGIVNAVAIKYHLDFGKTKIVFDSSLVIIAAVLSWLFFGEIRGLREGTLLSALLTGWIARFFIHHLSYIDAYGRQCFHWSFPFFIKRSSKKLKNKEGSGL